MLAYGVQHPVVHGRNQVRTHFQGEHGQRQYQRRDERALQPMRLGIARLRLALGMVVLVGDRAGFVTHLADGGDQGLRLRGGRVERHQGALGGQVYLRLRNTGHIGQGFFHALDARCAGHAFNGEFQLGK
ncbi:hypothetical protein D3C72_1880720 [compost metagenome]